jgi:hypothetical protein
MKMERLYRFETPIFHSTAGVVTVSVPTSIPLEGWRTVLGTIEMQSVGQEISGYVKGINLSIS